MPVALDALVMTGAGLLTTTVTAATAALPEMSTALAVMVWVARESAAVLRLKVQEAVPVARR